ncbi:polyphosphate:AMP phosphotransferase [Kaarinaea lacus]
MFRTAELGQKLSKKEYKAIEPLLREELLELQRILLDQSKTPVIIVFAGVDGGGKGETVQVLNAWMDARWLINRAYRDPSDEERERPEYWRYWRDLPPRGRIGLFLSSWYSRPVLDRVYGTINVAEQDERLDRIVSFENALAEDGALILKFWMHLSRNAQKARFKYLEKDPLLSWQVTEKDWEHWRRYENFTEAAERTIMRTNTGKASWNIVEGADPYFRSITVGKIIRDNIRHKLEQLADSEPADTNSSSPPQTNIDTKTTADEADIEKVLSSTTLLSTLDMSLTLSKPDYKAKLKKYQGKLNLLHREAMAKGISTIVVCEGPDAAGKGGMIRRLIAAIDPHNYQVLPFAAPTDEEQARHYLWRFWRHLSRAGDFSVFDRSWYGRVLVERVEGFASEAEWRRAYAEINDFEEQLIEHGIVLVKFWVHITKDEQLNRFKERENTPHKSWKLTEEDWRNREKWEDYEQAAHDMFQYTSTRYSPWVLVEGNSKYYARVKAVKTMCNYLEQALKRKNGLAKNSSK